jgi:hypothetical protein
MLRHCCTAYNISQFGEPKKRKRGKERIPVICDTTLGVRGKFGIGLLIATGGWGFWSTLRMATKSPVARFTFEFFILASELKNLCKREFQQHLVIKQELAKAYCAVFKAVELAILACIVAILAWIAASCWCTWATL